MKWISVTDREPTEQEADQPLWLYNPASRNVVLGAFNVLGTLKATGVGQWLNLDNGTFLREVSFWMVAEESMRAPLAPG